MTNQTSSKKTAKKKAKKKSVTKKKVNRTKIPRADVLNGKVFKVTPEDPNKHPAGRKSKEYNIEQVRQLAMLQCTDEEIAAVLGMSYRLLQTAKKNNPELKEVILRGREEGKASLRRAQWINATQRHSTQMQIHLGKNYLGQKDKVELGGSFEVKQPVINVTMPKVDQDYRVIEGEVVDDGDDHGEEE